MPKTLCCANCPVCAIWFISTPTSLCYVLQLSFHLLNWPCFSPCTTDVDDQIHPMQCCRSANSDSITEMTNDLSAIHVLPSSPQDTPADDQNRMLIRLDPNWAGSAHDTTIRSMGSHVFPYIYHK